MCGGSGDDPMARYEMFTGAYLLFDASSQRLEQWRALQLVVALCCDAVEQFGHLKCTLEADVLVRSGCLLLGLVRHAATQASANEMRLTVGDDAQQMNIMSCQPALSEFF